MPIEATGRATIRDKDTGVIYEIEPGELDWEAAGGGERGMGPVTLWQAKLEHPELGELRWEMTEYPEGAAGARSDDFNGHEVLENFDIEITHDPDEFVDWDDTEPSFDREAATTGMKEWFLRNYEDPANSLPHISAEGGYQWVHGGPTSAHEALGEEFGHLFPDDLIEEVADTLENEEGVVDWSPIPIPDFDDGEIVSATDEDQQEQAELVSDRLPLAEELLQNPETGAFYVRPKDIAKPDLLVATLSQISDAIDDVLQFPSNGLREDSLEVRKLRRALSKYTHDPQRLEMDFTTCGASLTAKIATEDLPPSDTIDALISALRDGAQGIRGTDPEIARNRLILQNQALREVPPDALEDLRTAIPTLKAITEGELQEQMREDIELLIKSADEKPIPFGGITRADAILSTLSEEIRIFARASRMYLALKKKTLDQINSLYDGIGYKALTMLGTFVSIAAGILALF